MKTVACEICGEEIPGDTVESCFTAIHLHWTTEHLEEMAKMAATGTKEEGEKWMANFRAQYEAA